MKPSQLNPGDLVRFSVSNSRWHFAVVREVDGDSVEVEYFWGAVESVPLESVTLFREYLDSRERVLSLERTAFCEAFFNNPLYRLREDRFQKIETVLRQHGIDFDPKHWPKPETRIKFWRDTSVVLNNMSDKDSRFAALLPRWLEPLKLPPSSRDPLGFQAHAERLANELLPGVTVFTSRIGYYGFLTWVIQFVNEQSCPTGESRLDRLQRLERAMALCEFTHHGAEDKSCPLLGQRSKTQVLQSAQADRFKVPTRILKNQTSAGAYRLNDFYNPFVLLVSRVGEEGIDLQKQCRYVVHYDLEWNPARMEQREGRVDRVGWGRSGEGFIDVRFMLLKGTYEERIFHTVMQRDQWFQILIGSKRRELGEIKGEEEDASEVASQPDSEEIEDVFERGRLTPQEKAAVMLDLRPSPVTQG